jgi:2EXR family
MSPWYKSLGKNLCRCVFYTICCPCILCVCVGRLTCCPNLLREEDDVHNDREWERSRKRLERGREARRVRPLGPGRKRELSRVTERAEIEQLDCPLFGRLPPEIRTLIWHYVLGGQRYHLMQVPKRVGYHCCKVGDTSDPGRSCCLPAMAYWRHENGTISYRDYMDRYPGAPLPHSPSVELFPVKPNSESRALALLQSCQRIYRETVNIPYQFNTFDIDDPDTLLSLRQTIPRQRLRSIRSLRLYIENQYPPFSGMFSSPWFGRFDGIWTLMWHTIAFDMTGLEELELIIQAGSVFPEWPRKDPPWVGKLRDIRGLKCFNLTMREGQIGFCEESDEDMKTLVANLRECMYQPRYIELPVQTKEAPSEDEDES